MPFLLLGSIAIAWTTFLFTCHYRPVSAKGNRPNLLRGNGEVMGAVRFFPPEATIRDRRGLGGDFFAPLASIGVRPTLLRGAGADAGAPGPPRTLRGLAANLTGTRGPPLGLGRALRLGAAPLRSLVLKTLPPNPNSNVFCPNSLAAANVCPKVGPLPLAISLTSVHGSSAR